MRVKVTGQVLYIFPFRVFPSLLLAVGSRTKINNANFLSRLRWRRTEREGIMESVWTERRQEEERERNNILLQQCTTIFPPSLFFSSSQSLSILSDVFRNVLYLPIHILLLYSSQAIHFLSMQLLSCLSL